jgi:hypothetical protein
LVRGVLASRWVSGAYLPGALALLTALAPFTADAQAASGGAGETARALIVELERDGSARDLVGPALSRAKEALSKAEAAPPTRAPLLEATALEWAEVARDLLRASAAERASDRLEQDASATQTEIARVRAAVEQTMARVGRARQELKELERGAASAAPGTIAPATPVAIATASASPAAKDTASASPATDSLATKRPATKVPAAKGAPH